MTRSYDGLVLLRGDILLGFFSLYKEIRALRVFIDHLSSGLEDADSAPTVNNIIKGILYGAKRD